MLAILAKDSSNHSTEITEEKIEAFKKNLTHYLEEQASTYFASERTWTIITEHGPEHELITACKQSNLPSSVFPTWTCMWFDPKSGTVKVQVGLHAKTKQVYPPVT